MSKNANTMEVVINDHLETNKLQSDTAAPGIDSNSGVIPNEMNGYEVLTLSPTPLGTFGKTKHDADTMLICPRRRGKLVDSLQPFSGCQ